MATLKPTLSLSSTDALSDAISFSVTDSLSILGDVRRFTMALTAGETELVEDQTILTASYNKTYVFLKNNSATANVTIGPATNDGAGDDALDTTLLHLGPEEFAFFPWDTGGTLLCADTTADGTLEVMLFEATA